MKTVTYEGPENELEQSDYLVVAGVRLPRGQAVQVDDKVAKAATEVKGHKVSTGKADDSAPAAQPTAHTPTEPAAGSETAGAGATDQPQA